VIGGGNDWFFAPLACALPLIKEGRPEEAALIAKAADLKAQQAGPTTASARQSDQLACIEARWVKPAAHCATFG
jgi:hypothetical protein